MPTAENQKPTPQDPTEFRKALKIGPDGTDLLTSRPYFLVDVDQNDSEKEADRIVGFLKAWKAALDPETPYRPVTDIYIYISSHGWHRNLFRGVAAYNRLASRLSILFRRGRLTDYVDLTTYSPLHINLHWNSDVDPDDWVDLDGRKRRDDFLEHIVPEFEPKGSQGSQTDLINLLEDVYQYITTTSAPDINPLEPRLQDNSAALFTRLKNYQIVAAPDATNAEKVTLIWTKYHEATALKTTQEQLEKPRSYATPVQRFMRASSFFGRVLIPVVGISALLDPFKSVTKLTVVQHWLNLEWPAKLVESLALYTALYLVGWALLARAARLNKRARENHNTVRYSKGSTVGPTAATQPNEHVRLPKPLDLPCIVSWAIMQVAHVVPVLAYCLLTYPSIVGLSMCWTVIALAAVAARIYLHVSYGAAGGVAGGTILIWALMCWTQWYATNVAFDERAGERGKDPSEDKLRKAESGTRERFTSRFASYPSELAHDGDLPYSRAYGLWDTVRSQLAIVRMQMRAVARAPKAEALLRRMLTEAKAEPHLLSPDVRIHLFGHSFGGLLVVNLAKHLAHSADPIQLQTVCTIQGAYASDWFVGEDKTLRNVKGWVAAIFTQYDTATGALYSLANAGRNGCGNIGLCSTRDNPLKSDHSQRVDVYTPLPNASLSSPPDLIRRLKLVDLELPPRTPDSHCPVLNIDCSRFMSEGAVATGGAHDDIFKSDTIHVLWSVAHQSDAFVPLPSPPLAPLAAVPMSAEEAARLEKAKDPSSN